LRHKKNREEPLGKAVDRIKKQFYKACELIMGEKYDSKKWRELFFPDEEPTQKHKRLRNGDAENYKDTSWEDDPETRLLFNDVVRICQACDSDPQCRDAILLGRIEEWDACPNIYKFLTE